jgi:hypothetical protein
MAPIITDRLPRAGNDALASGSGQVAQTGRCALLPAFYLFAGRAAPPG